MKQTLFGEESAAATIIDQSGTHVIRSMSANLGRFIALNRWQRKLPGCRNFYDWRTGSDSIFALSTSIEPKKGSPLGIVRVSGPATANVLQTIVKREPLKSTKLSTLSKTKHVIRPRYATLTEIFDPERNDLIDMGLVLWFPQPNSYTGEDACEFHVHGSQAIIKRLVTVLGSFDQMRPAEPGEFTRRAVANRKLDLMQAESLSDLISSQTDRQRKIALQGLTGSTRAKYDNWIESLVRILAHLEASIDFGEDELIGEQRVVNECTHELRVLAKEISDFISITGRCRDLTETGARVVILGRPNAGKSTFMNILCRQDKSIVSNVSGTTRDLIEHSFELGGHKITLCDTAGLKDLSFSESKNFPGVEHKQNHDDIEKEGIKRALDAAKLADLIMYLVEVNQITGTSTPVIAQEVFQTLKTIKAHENIKSIHLVVNKIDLLNDTSCKIDSSAITSALREVLHESTEISVTMVSCRTQNNIDKLIERVSKSLDRLHLDDNQPGQGAMEYVNERHLSLLESTLRHLDRAKDLKINKVDEMAQHVRESVDYLSRIVGNVTNEQVIDIIFRDFCIGK